jgi:hypothetical protein
MTVVQLKISGLLQAKFRALQELPEITKTRTAKVPLKNGGQYSYKYADLSDILSIVQPILLRNDLMLTHSTLPGANGRDQLITRLVHVKSGESEESIIELPEYSGPQELGSLLTYFRRYEVCLILGIQADEDEDGAVAQQAARTAKVASVVSKVAPVAPAPVTQTGTGADYVIKFGKNSGKRLGDLPEKDLTSFVSWLQSKSQEEGKPLSANAAEFINAVESYLGKF